MSFTEDEFLGGRLTIRQPASGYRAGADPVFLAAAVPAQAGQRILDLGCGSGVALLCLAARVPGLSLTGVERDPGAVTLARENARENEIRLRIVEGDVGAMPPELTAEVFDHVMTNPPFFERSRGTAAADGGREAGRGEAMPLTAWLDAGLRRLSPGGTLTLIQRAERLPACLSALEGRLGDVVVLPLAPREGRPAKLVILHGRKGAKGPFRLAAPFVLHRGMRHQQDGDSYTEAAGEILRGGKALSLGV